MESIKIINDLIKRKLLNCTIVRILELSDKSMFIVNAIPNKYLNRSEMVFDTLWAIDSKTYEFLGNFNPLEHKSDLLKDTTIIYER